MSLVNLENSLPGPGIDFPRLEWKFRRV